MENTNERQEKERSDVYIISTIMLFLAVLLVPLLKKNYSILVC